MQLLAPVRFFTQFDVFFACVNQSRTRLQSVLLRIQYLPTSTTRFISGNKSVEKTNESNDVEDKRKKNTRKKCVYYNGGKPKYSTGEPLSKRHVSRISVKYFYGPLLETKKERITREKREERKLLQKDTNEPSAENLLERILETTKQKKKNVRFAVNEYDRVAALYSGQFNASKQVKKNTCEALNNAKENSSSDASCYDTHHQTNNGCNGDVSASSASISGTDEQLSLSAQLQIIQTIGSNFESVQPALSISPNLIEVDNCKYVDAPRYLDLHRLHTFPLFRDNKNPLQSPFNASYHNINSGVETIMEMVEDEDTSMDQSTNDGITSIGYHTSGSKSLPSVSRILSETMPEASKIALAKWEAKMISELGEQGFQDYKKELFSQGSLLHKCIHANLQHSRPPSASALSCIEGFWRSVEPVVAEVRQGAHVAALESRVIHPHLQYGGVLDCVAIYRNTPMIVEWKTSTKPKRTLKATYDNPLQIAAYLGALQHDPAYRHLQVQSGLLAFAYGDGSSSDTHILSRATLERYWSMWLARLATFWKINSVGRAVREEAARS